MVRLFRVLLFSLYIASSLGQLPSPDILALLQFKKGIKHDPTGYLLNSWNEDSIIGFHGCPSSWNGIVCNAGHVVDVILDNLSLSGEADLSVFVNLTKLVKLSMANNSINGIIPVSIGSLDKLEYLDISNNLFSSSLPSGFGNLASLQNASLAGNNFSGLIPNSISGLTSIKSLDFSRNSFSGPISSSFTKLGSLVNLNLSENRFIKKIPKGFELLTSLEVLDLHGNMLDGNLDEEFLLFSSAKYVDLSDNQLDNSGPQNQKFLPGISETIKYLNLSHNKLTGSLIGQTQLFENLNVLDLSYNVLSGDLPEFNFVYDLEVLRLSNNKFSGFVPNDLLKGDPVLLTELDLSRNNLTGPISFITSTTLRVLNLSSNALSGELPLLTGDCAILDLSNNHFEGNLTKLTKWRNIEFLDLSQNSLTGLIPDIMSELLHLNHLNLSHNSLIGSIPKSVTQFPKLSILDLSFNRLVGPIQASLFTMSTLQELYLSSNSINGNLELSSPPDESNLRVVDLSHNRLSGYFPEKFGLLNDLEVLNLAGNNLSGSLPTSMNEMSSLTSLDLSQNHFTGSLPSNLSSHLQHFNASYNELSGVVPENLRKFSHSSFYPGNSKLQLPTVTPRPESSSEISNKKSTKTPIKVVIIVSCVAGFIILILLAIFVYYICVSRKRTSDDVPKEDSRGLEGNPRNLVISAEDITTPRKVGSSTEIISTYEKPAALSDFSSPDSAESLAVENPTKLEVGSPDRLAGELYFLDDTMSLTPEELSRAPAEVLGRSSHGTSYRATLDNGMFLTVKWLREGVAKPKKDFAKEARKFANIRHPNVVAYRGYYWGPTQHEKLILSEYILPGSLASLLYDRPGRKGQPLTWRQRLKIAVDVARGLNYLHFDRALPHGNLKSNNILLDGSELNARVSDYCLHRLMTQNGTIEQILDAGVLGYRAPELGASKKPVPSFKSDVYAFGVIVLELLTGRCAGEVVSGEGAGVDLTDWVRVRVAEGHGSECFDPVLSTETTDDPNVGKATNEVLGIALRCIRAVSERPRIKTIYEDLSSI